MKIGNSTSTRDVSDIRPQQPQSLSQGHRGGRRTSVGNSSNAGGPGAKERFLSDARSANKAHVKAFRSGSQDARDAKGPVSRHPNLARRGAGSSSRKPSPSGGM